MKDNKDIDVSRFVPDNLQQSNSAVGEPSVDGQVSGETASPTLREEAISTRSGDKIESVPKTGQPVRTRLADKTESTPQTEQPKQVQPAKPTQPIQPYRVSSRQRKASLEEYREIFMVAPKLTDRQPVFVSREVRDRIDNIVRRLGERKMSVSGFLENLSRHHLELYSDDLEQWKRL